MAAVVRKLDRYAQKDNTFLARYAYVVGNLGTYYQQVKNFSKAKKNLAGALELLQQAGKRQDTAAVYHQLGMVAAEERDWAEAKAHYREALKIYQEFNDRYSQAGTFHQLGMVAKEEKDYALALGYYTEALEIFSQYKDKFSLEIVRKNLARLLKTTTPPWDPGAALAALDANEETKTQVRKLL